jgi:DNA replication protein DnaC
LTHPPKMIKNHFTPDSSVARTNPLQLHERHKAVYFSMNRFIEHIATVRLNGSYTRFLNTLSKTPLLVLDDFGLAQLDINMQLTLLQIMEDRYKKFQIMITSQLPVKE